MLPICYVFRMDLKGESNMAKKDKGIAHSTDELIAKRQHLVRGAVWSGIAVFLVVLFLYVAYLVALILTRGYGSIAPIGSLNSWSAQNFTLPYLTGDNAQPSAIPALAIGTADMWQWLRVALFVGVLLIGALLGLWTFKGVLKHNEKKASDFQKKTFKNFIKEEIGLDSVFIASTDVSRDQDVFNQVGLQSTAKNYIITLASDIMSFDVCQIRHGSGKKRSALLFVTELEQPKTAGYIQFRSFGKTPYKLHNGKAISTYALNKIPSDNPFVVSTDLDKDDIASFVDDHMVETLVRFRALTKSNVLVTLNDNTLSLFVDGAELSILRPLSTKIDKDLLENQSSAVGALYECVLSLTRSFSLLPSNVPMVRDRIGEREDESSADVSHALVA